MANGFSIRISAVDGATKQIDLINRKLASMRAPVDRMRASLAKLANVSGLNALSASFERLSRIALNVGRSLASILPGLGAITGAATLAGMYSLVSSWAEFGSRLAQNSRLISVSVDRLHAMQGAARLMGSDAEALTSGLTTLANNIQDGIAGRAPDFVRRMTDMGISLTDANGKARNTADVFTDIQRVMSRYTSPMVRAQTATELFGGAALALLPVLEKTPQAFADAQARARSYGVETEESTRRAEQLRTAQEGLKLAFEGMGRAVANRVGPKLTKLFDDMSAWVTRMTPEVIVLTERFLAWADSLKWDEIKKGAEDFWNMLKRIGDQIDTILTVSGVLLALWVGTKFLGAITAVTRLATAVGVLSSASTLTGLTGAFATLARFAGPLGLLAAGIGFINQLQGTSEEQRGEMRQNWRERARVAPSGAPPAPAASGDLAQRQDAIIAAALEAGFSESAAIGIAANATHESAAGALPTGDGGNSGGVIHWNGPRRRAFAEANGGVLPENAPLLAQMQWLRRETEGSERGNSGFTSETDPGYAASAMSLQFVRPLTSRPRGVQEQEAAARGQTARQIEDRRRRAGGTAPRGVDAVVAPRPQQQSSLSGNARLEVSFANPPAGMTARGTTSGNVFAGAPNISMGMPSYASA